PQPRRPDPPLVPATGSRAAPYGGTRQRGAVAGAAAGPASGTRRRGRRPGRPAAAEVGAHPGAVGGHPRAGQWTDGVTKGGLTTCIGARRPRMSTSTSEPASRPAAVSSNASPIPTLRVGEKVPLV